MYLQGFYECLNVQLIFLMSIILLLQSPLQQNMCDCGVFLLHYVEVFLRHPVQVLDAIVVRIFFFES